MTTSLTSSLSRIDCIPDPLLKPRFHLFTPPQGMQFNEMRSKTKVLQKPVTSFNAADFPEWSFDGSSTGQAEGRSSDCILR